MSNVEVEEIGPDDDEQGAEAFRPKPKSATSKALMAIKGGAVMRPIVPDGIDQLYTMAKMIYASGLAPKDMSVDQIAVAVMVGAEIGLLPLQSLQGIAVINGRPSVWGATAMALVRRSGLMESIREWTEVIPALEVEITNQKGEKQKITREERIAHCAVKRVDEDEKDFTFSVSDAMLAGLWNNSKKPIWQQYPDRMLKMRARGFAFRDVFPDAIAGLYLREEAVDFEPIDITPSPPPLVQTSGLSKRLKTGANPAAGGFDEAHVASEMREPDLAEKLRASLAEEEAS